MTDSPLQRYPSPTNISFPWRIFRKRRSSLLRSKFQTPILSSPRCPRRISSVIGYHARQLAFIILATQADTAPALSTQPKDLFLVLEAVDPFAIVLTDHHAVEVASSAYNVPLTLEQRELLLGHGCCCFESFEELLKTTEGKQKAWKCLKTLPLLSVLQP